MSLVIRILWVYCSSERGLVEAILVYKVMMQHGVHVLEDVTDDKTHRAELRANIITFLQSQKRGCFAVSAREKVSYIVQYFNLCATTFLISINLVRSFFLHWSMWSVYFHVSI